MALNVEQQGALAPNAPVTSRSHDHAYPENLQAQSQTNQAQFMRGFDRYNIIKVDDIHVNYSSKWHRVTDISTKNNWSEIKHYPKAAKPWSAHQNITPSNRVLTPREIGIRIHEERAAAAAVHLIPMPFFLPITREDMFALEYLLTPFRAFKTLLTKPEVFVIAEIPVFGFPLGCKSMITGRIDQVIWNREENIIRIGDLKTSASETVWKFHEAETTVQLNLYQRMVEDFLTGNVELDAVAEIVNFDVHKEFSPHFQQGVEELCGFHLHNLDQLYAFMVSYLRPLPKTFVLFIEYVHQPTRATFQLTSVTYEENKLKEKLVEFFDGYVSEEEDFDPMESTSDYESDTEISPVGN